MNTRRLALKRETLTELPTNELALVVAAGPHTLDLQCLADAVTTWIRSGTCILAGPDHTRDITCDSNPCTR